MHVSVGHCQIHPKMYSFHRNLEYMVFVSLIIFVEIRLDCTIRAYLVSNVLKARKKTNRSEEQSDDKRYISYPAREREKEDKPHSITKQNCSRNLPVS